MRLLLGPCRRGGSARRQFPFACPASRRRYSRGSAPRSPGTWRSCHTGTAEFLRHSEPNTPISAIRAKMGQGYQLILQMPFMSMRRDFGFGKAPELVTHHLQRFIRQRRIAPITLLGHQRGNAHPHGGRGAGGYQSGDGGISAKCRQRPRGMPISSGRIISPWLSGSPPDNCARYSPNARL